MKKDILLQYQKEIHSLTLKLIRDDISNTKPKLCRIDNMYSTILNEVLLSSINKSSIEETGYLIMCVESNYLREEDFYMNLLFIFNLKTSEVLNLLIPCDEPTLDHSNVIKIITSLYQKDSFKSFFKKLRKKKIHLEQLLYTTDEISKIFTINHLRIKKAYNDTLQEFFNIIATPEMLTLFGYYLYAYIYRNDIDKKKYAPIINITYNPKTNSFDEIRSVCSLLYTILTCDKKLSSKNVIDATDLSKNATLQSILKKTTTDIIIVDYSNPTRKDSIEKIFSDSAEVKVLKTLYPNGHYYKKSTRTFIIVSKKLISNKSILPITFNDLNRDNLIKSKSFLEDMQDFVDKFREFVYVKHDRCSDIDNTALQKAAKKMSNKIYETSIQEKSKCDKYAPIALALYDFFEFMKNKAYISKDDYNTFIDACNEIWGAKSTQISIPKTTHSVDPVIVLLKVVYDLYSNYPTLFSNNTDTEPFIYINPKEQSTLICFDNISHVISFVEKNIGNISSYDDYKDTFMQPNTTKDFLNQIRTAMIQQSLLVTNKSRKDYRIGNKAYFALDVSKVEKYLNECE